MADQLTKMFDDWKKSHPDSDLADEFQLFQAGVTAGAVSMRDRAIKALQSIDPAKGSPHHIKNLSIDAVGQLSDIPQS